MNSNYIWITFVLYLKKYKNADLYDHALYFYQSYLFNQKVIWSILIHPNYEVTILLYLENKKYCHFYLIYIKNYSNYESILWEFVHTVCEIRFF